MTSAALTRLKRVEHPACRYVLLRGRGVLHYARRGHSVRRRVIQAHLAGTAQPRLHFGAGPNRLGGWLNSDLVSGDVYIDLGRPLPLPDGGLAYMFGEHVIGHLSESQGVAVLSEAHRVLRPGGVLRLTTPDLAKLIALYTDANPVVRRDEYTRHLEETTGKPTRRPAQMLNDLMRLWGIRYTYDEEDLVAKLREAGFVEVQRVEPGESRHSTLRGIERHGDPWVNRAEALCIEATRPIEAGGAGARMPLAAARGPRLHVAGGFGALAAIIAAAAAVVLGPTALLVAVALIGVGVLLRYPPVLLAAFVFVPFFEEAPLIRLLPGDPTVMLGALLVGVYARRLAARSVAAIPAGLVVPFLLIGAALAVGLIGTPAPAYGGEKVLKYFTVTLIAAVAPFFVVRTRAELMQFMGAIAAGGIVIAAVTPFLTPTVIPGITFGLDTEGRYSFGGQIMPARFLCTAALVLIAAPALHRGRVRYLGPAAAVGVMFVALGFGARGPIVAFVVALAGVVLLSGLRAPRQLVLVLLAVVAAGMALPLVALPGQSASRLAEVASDPAGVLRGDTRAVLYDEAVRLIRERPLTGIGTGGFAAYTLVLMPPKFTVEYPHNIFLELSTDVGVVPALVLVLPIAAGLAILLRRVRVTADRAERHIAVLVLGLFLLNLFASQFSGDINDNRTLWLFLALAWLIGRDGVRSEPLAGGRAP